MRRNRARPLEATGRAQPHRVVSNALAEHRVAIPPPGAHEALDSRQRGSFALGVGGVAGYPPPPMRRAGSAARVKSGISSGVSTSSAASNTRVIMPSRFSLVLAMISSQPC